MAKQTTQTRKKKKRKPKVIDVSKLKRAKEITVEIEVEGRVFMSVLEVGEDATYEEIKLAKENLKRLIKEQFAEAKKKTSKWLRFRRWVLSFFYNYD